MLGFPKGSDGTLQFEEDLAQIRHDISMIQNDLFWMSQFGTHVLNIMMELRYIRRMMEINLGEITREDARMRMRVDQG